MASTIIDSSTSSSSSVTSGQKSKDKLDKQFDQFLQMFVTMMQHQDPLAPMDSNQFTQSLASLTSVEQAVNTNLNLEKLINVMGQNSVGGAVSYLDKMVDYESTQTELTDSGADFSYVVDSTSNGISVLVQDSTGAVVRSFDGNNFVGTHDLHWDGNDNYGNKVPKGTYTIRAYAIDADNGKTPITTLSSGLVTGANMDSGNLTLIVNGEEINQAAIHRIKSASGSSNSNKISQSTYNDLMTNFFSSLPANNN